MLCRENTVERVSLQQLPAGEVVVTIAGANVSEWLPLPATYALVVQGNFTCVAEQRACMWAGLTLCVSACKICFAPPP